MVKLFFSFDGRIGRKSFWLAFLTLWVVLTLFGVAYREIDILRVPVGILALLLYVSFFAVATKRYHDQDKSGWSSLIFLAPVVGWLYVMIECGFWQGSAMRNQYGQPLYGPLTSIGLDEDDS